MRSGRHEIGNRLSIADKVHDLTAGRSGERVSNSLRVVGGGFVGGAHLRILPPTPSRLG